MITTGLCRDCFTISTYEAGADLARCTSCGLPRVVMHEELTELWIAHVDCDAFYASVEKRDRPEIRDQPVIIGGGRRGVASTCCYIARRHGVRSAMPMFMALKLCPDAVVIRPDMKKYSAASKLIRHEMDKLTPMVQPISIDEAFLDLTGTERLHNASAAETLARFAATIEETIGVTISIGLSHNKFLAKIASDLNKPRGFAVIGKAETREFLAKQPVGLIWGVGKVMQNKLKADGIHKIGQIQTMDPSNLAKKYGTMGLRLAELSHGKDSRKVETVGGAKSVSSETTFNNDISEKTDLLPILRRLSEKVSERLKYKSIAGNTVVLKLKSANFKTRTRNRTLSDPTQLADRIFHEGATLLAKETDGTKYRLIGIGVSDLCDDNGADPDDLVDLQAQKRRVAEYAMDEIRKKFGRDGVDLGLTFKPKQTKSSKNKNQSKPNTNRKSTH
ncbi:MAG: DNA polymerase IV [Rhizobiales bacterium]|nr:DNA polymerase IV [Hyphomicrobiales bacterium]